MHDGIKSPENQAFSIKRHGICLKQRVLHNRLHGLFPSFFGGPLNPGEYDSFVGFAGNGLGKGCQFAIWYLIAPAIDHGKRAIVLEQFRNTFGVRDKCFTPVSWNGHHHTIDIAHISLPQPHVLTIHIDYCSFRKADAARARTG